MVDERNPRDEFGNEERQKTKKGMDGKDEEGRAGKKSWGKENGEPEEARQSIRVGEKLDKTIDQLKE